MKLAEFKELFQMYSIDVEEICQANFQNVADELHHLNCSSLAKLTFISEGSFVEILMYHQKNNKVAKEKTMLNALQRFEARSCWYKDSKGDAIKADQNIIECLQKAELGQYVIGYITPFSYRVKYFDSLEDGICYLKDKGII